MGSKFKKILKKIKKAKKKDKKGNLSRIHFTSDKRRLMTQPVLQRYGQGGRYGQSKRDIYLPDPGGGGRDKDKDKDRDKDRDRDRSRSSSRSGGGGGGRGESRGQRTTGPSNERGFSFYEGTEGMTPAEFELYKDIKLRGIDSENANKLQNIINKGKLDVAVIQRDASIYGSLVSGFW